MIRNYDQINTNLETKKEKIIDARSKEDFNKINPVLGVPNNIPNSVNIPYSELFDPNTGTIKNLDQLMNCN